ncbi:amino acid synthesis family protein [Pelagicoccus albus]|uniref:Amino acid synthesis family protein n=1 Tax=Pelagicoccus albus TaxID=415222 RepID=A0A7X1EA00_9BACT|nr:amino acid synthesis family protein [Pelagicoccus albus]MBC2607881.1 amino acid synthesis family protein [Pelagicoccus albus]
MGIKIRKWIQRVEEDLSRGSVVFKKIAVGAVVENPYAGVDADSLDEIIEPSLSLSGSFVDRLLSLLGDSHPVSYGKAAVVGSSGEFEHGKAFLTTRFVDPIRAALGNAKSWVPSTCLRSSVGSNVDVPTGAIHDLFGLEENQTISLNFGDSPNADEVIVVFVIVCK